MDKKEPPEAVILKAVFLMKHPLLGQMHVAGNDRRPFGVLYQA